MAHHREGWMLGPVLAAVLVLSACGSFSPASTRPPSSSTPPISAAVRTTIPTPTTAAVTSTTAHVAATTTTTVAMTACGTSGLTAGMGGWSRTTRGTDYILSFYNAGSIPCFLQGYPSVAFVDGGASGRVGAAAQHLVTTAPLVVLAPGGRAEARVTVTDPDLFPVTCVVSDVLGFRVYPPGSTGSMAIPHVARTCANPAYVTLGVGAVQAP